MEVITEINNKKISMDLIRGKRNNKAISIVDYIYPVGAIYISTVNTNPQDLFGGTWEQIKDRFLLSTGDSYTSGSTGGEATHTLTIAEMPAHHHNIGNNRGSGNMTWSGLTGVKNADGVVYGYPTTGDTGGGQSHNNMPPYLVVYMWKRTA